MSLFPFDSTQFYSIIASLNNIITTKVCNLINPTMALQSGDVAKVVVLKDESKQNEIDDIAKCSISLSKQDWDSHENSWDFKRNPIIEEQLQVFVDNMAEIMPNMTVDDITDYHAPELLQPISILVDNYKAKWEDLFHQLHHNEEELNRQFIEIYGLQDELTPDVPLNEVTILQKGEISIEDGEIVWHDDVIIKQLISYLIGCFMGRYSIDRPGLIIASQHQDLNELGLKVEGIDNDAKGRIAIDDDGIVPILEGEYFADDMTVRIEQAIKVLFGEARLQENLKYINEKLGKTLREYLFKDFFADHIDGKMYQKRPIYWLFSSKMGDKKKKGYFKALVYMHRIESDTLSKLHADYVSPYIDKIEQQRQEAEDNAIRDDLSATQRNKANKLAAELAEQVRELKEYSAILAQMSTQRISIDLDDGVRVNYPKFYPLVEPIKGLDKED